MPETTFLAEGAIEVGEHNHATWLGMTVNTDTIMSTGIAALIVLALAFFLRAKITSTGVPSGVQLFWEAITVQMRDQIESAVGMRIAPFVLPLAVTIFVFILISNWLSVLPLQYTDASGHTTELLKSAAADINYVLALALFVFVCYHVAGIWRRGVVGHPSPCSRATWRSWRRSTSSRSWPSQSRCRCDFSATSSPAASWSR